MLPAPEKIASGAVAGGLGARSLRRLATAAQSPLLVALLSAFGGAFVALAVVPYLSGALWTAPAAAPGAAPVGSCAAVKAHTLSFSQTAAEDALGELSADEVQSVARWFAAEHGAAGTRNSSADCVWLAGPSAVELLIPLKNETVAYIEGRGPRPQRFARVTAVGRGNVEEYKVGPLVDGRVAPGATAEVIRAAGAVPFARRPTETNADNRLSEALLNSTLRGMAPLLTEAFGPVFPQLDGYDESKGTVGYFNRNDALRPEGDRADMLIFQLFPANTRVEAAWLHPIPLLMKVNTTSSDPAAWTVFGIYFCSQGPYSSAAELMADHSRGQVRICPFNASTGIWDVPQRTTPKSEKPRAIEPHGGVSWGPWSFTLTQRPSTGPAMVDVRFRGERILYELSLQDAFAGYSGDESSQFFYADASWSMSMLSTSLLPGVDCPEDAHYLSAVSWMTLLPGGVAEADPTQPHAFYPICVFEFTEDHTLWRHMQNSDPPDVRGLLRKTIVVRSVATVANYDYITDIKLREDGEIEVKTRFAGFIESRYFDPVGNPAERKFSTILRPDLAGPVHSHLVNWKADIDVAGVRANAFQLTKVKAGEVESRSSAAGEARKLVSKYIERSVVEREGVGVSTFVAHPEHPTIWAVVDQKAVSPAGNPRGYAVQLGCWSTTQVLPFSHPFVKATPLTKYHIAVTRHHDGEYRSSEVYAQYDAAAAIANPQDLDRYLSDNESLVDEDIVAWIGVGREHIVRQEDLPLVSNFGAGFSLQPFNFFSQNVAASPPWTSQ